MIPLATTTVTVTRPASDPDRDLPQTPTDVAAGVRAHISAPSGQELRAGGSRERVDARLTCDVIDLQHGDTITDDTTGDEWRCTSARQRLGLGLDHVEAGLVAVSGVV